MPQPLTFDEPDAPVAGPLTFDDAPAVPEMPEGMVYDPSTGQVIDTVQREAVQERFREPYTGSLLPFMRDETGVHFDSNAGLLGAIKSAFTLPGQVYQGEVDPGSDEAIRRSLDLAMVASPLNPGVRAGDRAIAGVADALQKRQAPVPTSEELKAASSAGYDAVRSAGVDYRADAVANMASGLRSGLERDGILAELAPKTFRILEKLESPPEGSVANISGLEAARRAFGHAAKDFNNPTDQEAARRVVGGLDRWLETDDPSRVVAGAASEVAGSLKAARGNYAAAKRSDKLTGLEDAAELRAAVAASGQNADNAIRQRIASLLLKPRDVAGYSGGEREALESVARGSGFANTARSVGNMLGGGGGLGAMISGGMGSAVGAAVGGWPGAAAGGALPPALGAVAKAMAARATRNDLNRVDRMTRMRSPLYEERMSSAPTYVPDLEARGMIARALMSSRNDQ